MTTIHCAGFKLTGYVRSVGDLYAVAVKFNESTYGIISSPDTLENTKLIRGQKGQIILKWAQGFDTDGVEFLVWNDEFGWNRFASKLIAGPIIPVTGQPSFRKYNGFNLTPIQVAYWESRGRLHGNSVFPFALTLQNSKLVESGFPSSLSISNISGAITLLGVTGAPAPNPNSGGFADGHYWTGTLWRDVTSTISNGRTIGAPGVGFVITTPIDFTWVIA